MRKPVKIVALITTAIVCAAYIIALLAIFIPPHKSTLIVGIGMGLPIIWLCMIIATVFWLCFKKWTFASVLAILLAIGFPSWRNTIVCPTNKATDTKGTEVKIMSYNVQLFGDFNHYEEILQLITDENPDIVCLQEFGHYYNNPKQAKYSKNNLLLHFQKNYPYSHRWYKNQWQKTENGLATFSKYPITNKEKVMYSSKNNVSILSDINIKGTTIRLINNHLESNKLSSKQKDDIKQAITGEGQFIAPTKDISATIGKASNIRTEQARKVRQYLDKSPHPTIVCGDFNDVPQSYVFNTIKGSTMNSAYAMAGTMGYYWTYNQPIMLFPIDHILIHNTLPIKQSHIIKKQISDHYPITSTFIIPLQ